MADTITAWGVRDGYFVDGALKKTMHASVALDAGVDLLLCLNPLLVVTVALVFVADKFFGVKQALVGGSRQ